MGLSSRSPVAFSWSGCPLGLAETASSRALGRQTPSASSQRNQACETAEQVQGADQAGLRAVAVDNRPLG